jgi:hypothetical protein
LWIKDRQKKEEKNKYYERKVNLGERASEEKFLLT